jgi:alkaline phosphatase D
MNEADYWSCLFQRRASRREFIAAGRDVAAFIAMGALPAAAGERQFRFASDPFTLGVASGDPESTSVVLWTRLDPAVLAEADAGGARVEVRWEIARDEKFERIARAGSTLAAPELGHSVHAEVGGLTPGDYWYRFTAGRYASATGRTRLPSRELDRLRFAVASCQNYEHGFYTAHRHLAADDLDAVVFLGDYIYERRFTSAPAVRQHEGGEVQTLDEYRRRYVRYRQDPDLQAVHAAFPWILAPDDHEVANNYAGSVAEDTSIAPTQFLLRRAAAYQAYYEFMPFRRASMPKGPDMRLYRRLSFGSLVSLFMLDTRQYRSDQPCGDGKKARCAESLAAVQSMMGKAQERWLFDGLRDSRSRWNVLGNQVMISEVKQTQNGVDLFDMDKWNGYVEARRRLLAFLAEARPANPVAITGDIHTHWVADLKLDFADPKSATVGTEFVGTSISSGGDGNVSTGEDIMVTNPHIKFFSARRGYVRITATPATLHADYRVVPFVSRPGAPIETRASFVVENGKPGAQRA